MDDKFLKDIEPSLRYRMLKLIERHPKISQRELANELGLSLGKMNYSLRALMAKGLVKANNFRNSSNKLAYAYFLTPKGLEEKVRVTQQFFRRVEAEYEILKREVEQLGEKASVSVEQEEGS